MDAVPRRVHSVRSLRFPNRLGSALDEFVEAMWPFGVFDDALLGGGTVLAARWRHRVSTDLDFFMPYGAFRDLIVARESEVTAALRKVAFGAVVRPFHIQCVIRTGAVAVGIHTSMYGATTADELAEDVAGERRVRTQTTAAILARKIVGRMMGQGVATVRDVYDLCVAEKEDPEALLAAGKAVPSGVLVRSADALEYDLEGDWRRKPLIEPAHLAIAENLASCGRDVLLRLARHVDSAHKGEGVCR